MKVEAKQHDLGTIPMVNGKPIMVGIGFWPSKSRRPQANAAFVALTDPIEGKVICPTFRVVMS